MRQTISLLLTGMLLLAACSASGAETMETAAEYPEPRYYFEDLTAKETFTAEDGTALAGYDYRLFTLAADNLDELSPKDREGRAFVHYAAWREAYTGLMPEAVLEAHTLERCRESAQRGSSGNTFVALDREDGDRVVGFAALCRSARDFVSVPEAGEIAALYVLQEYQGLGLGRQLLEHCLAWIPRPRVALFVLEGNEKAIRFYEHMGFRPTGHRIVDERDGDTLVEIEMCLERDTHQ